MKKSVLLKQAYRPNPDQTVEQLVAETAKTVGSPVKIIGFARLSLGEGIDKEARRLRRRRRRHDRRRPIGADAGRESRVFAVAGLGLICSR